MDNVLTDELFELVLERKADRLDELFLANKMTQEQYDREYKELERLTKQQYSNK